MRGVEHTTLLRVAENATGHKLLIDLPMVNFLLDRSAVAD